MPRRFAHRPLFLIALLVIAAASGCVGPRASRRAALTERLDEILTRNAETGATVTARVLELPSGRELYAREPDTPFTPASNMKVPISAAGLDMFGLEHTFDTTLALIDGDLVVIGSGDPGIGDPRLARRRGETPIGVFDEWADALRARGVTHIAGDLVYDDRALDREWTHPTWGADVLYWYGAPTGGLNFNDNCIDITIHPTTPGQLVRVEMMPPGSGVTVRNQCVTGAEHAPTIEKLPGQDVVVLGGTCSETAELKSKPVEDPGRFFCNAFRAHLAEQGINVAGEIRRSAEPLWGTVAPDDPRVVAVARTKLRDVIGRINTNSQNFFAEALCKLTGQAYVRRFGWTQPGSWLAGELALRDFLRRNAIDERHYVLADGSGLSDHNRLTARLLTDLFRVMFVRPDRDAWIDSLAKGGVDGTLEVRYADLAGHVFAKTGYISGVRALSGYVRTRDDQWLTFSIIYNHIPGSVTPYEALQDEAVGLLVEWPNVSE